MYEVAIFKMFAYIRKGHQSYINRGGPFNGLPNPTWSVGKNGPFLRIPCRTYGVQKRFHFISTFWNFGLSRKSNAGHSLKSLDRIPVGGAQERGSHGPPGHGRHPKVWQLGIQSATPTFADVGREQIMEGFPSVVLHNSCGSSPNFSEPP